MGEGMAISMVGALFAVLSAVIGWLGTRVMRKLDELDNKLDLINVDMVSKLSQVDGRIRILEVLGHYGHIKQG